MFFFVFEAYLNVSIPEHASDTFESALSEAGLASLYSMIPERCVRIVDTTEKKKQQYFRLFFFFCPCFRYNTLLGYPLPPRILFPGSLPTPRLLFCQLPNPVTLIQYSCVPHLRTARVLLFEDGFCTTFCFFFGKPCSLLILFYFILLIAPILFRFDGSGMGKVGKWYLATFHPQ